jgi:hypothetical protein
VSFIFLDCFVVCPLVAAGLTYRPIYRGVRKENFECRVVGFPDTVILFPLYSRPLALQSRYQAAGPPAVMISASA